MPKSKNSANAQPSTLSTEQVEISNQKNRVQALIKNLMQMCHFIQSVPPHFPPNMVLPYIEGSCMDWTVNDGLYHRFLKCRLKYLNILECELATLPKCQNCKKVVAQKGDYGMDQYVSWSLPKEDLSMGTIWECFEECCKPQANEVRAHFDLLTSFRQGTRSVDKWYNAVQVQIKFAKKMESSKARARHIKLVAGDPQVAQINLMCH